MDSISKTKATVGNSKQGYGTTGGATNNPIYEDFDPHMEWAREEINFDTLLVYLPGFQKDKLKIQITSGGKLRITGERIVGQNKWRRFHKEFPLAADCDTNKISAKFEGGILYVKVPKSPNNITTNSPIVKDHEKPKPTPKPMSTTTPSDQPIPASQSDKKPSNAKADSKEMPKNDNNDTKAEKDSKTSTNKPDEKQQQKSSSANNNTSKLAAQATSTSDVSGKTMTRLETYKKKFAQHLASDRVVKSPRALINIILAVLFIGVLALYVKNAFKSIGHSNGSNEL